MVKEVHSEGFQDISLENYLSRFVPQILILKHYYASKGFCSMAIHLKNSHHKHSLYVFSYNSTYASLKVIGADWHKVNKLLMIFISGRMLQIFQDSQNKTQINENMFEPKSTEFTSLANLKHQQFRPTSLPKNYRKCQKFKLR